MPTKAKRLNHLPPYVFSVIGDRIRQMQKNGIDVYRLDIGNPDLPPPKHVVEALCESAHAANTHGYTGYRGKTAFRQAVADYYLKRYNVELDPDQQVLPLLGSKEGIVNLCLAYLDQGDLALVPAIGYPSYSMGALLAGGEVEYVPTRSDNQFRIDLDAVPEDTLEKAKILWVNYPNNPTGAVVDIQFYEHVVAVCQQYDILLASDNPYNEVVFDGYTAPSALQADPEAGQTIEFLSFSKSYNMAGWRLGAAVGSSEAIETLLSVKSNIDSGHFEPVYDGGIAALKTNQLWIEERNAIYERRRDKILSVLPQIGLTAQKSQGSLYIWAKITDGDTQSYVENALEHACVSIAPGSAYGPGGDGYVRISLGVPDKRLDEALNNLIEWYQS